MEIDELRGLLVPMFKNFEDFPAHRARDVGTTEPLNEGEYAPLRQPEIDRTATFEKKLLACAAYDKARNIAAGLLGQPAHYVFDHAICKMPGSTTRTAWHQDQGYLRYGVQLQTLNFWIPLQDVDAQNGTMQYLPGSQHGMITHETQAPGYHAHVKTVREVDQDRVVTCPLKAGDLVLHHPLTLHGAGPNLSDHERLAWSVHFSAMGRYEYLRPRNLLSMLNSWYCTKMLKVNG